MNRVRFCLHPGYIWMRGSGNRGYIDEDKLMLLYGVKADECVVYDGPLDPDHKPEGLTCLYPDFLGKYQKPNPR